MSPRQCEEHLASRVRDALADDPRLNALDVEVRIVAGAVHLHGQLASTELLAVAEQIAREQAPGMAIVNRLAVFCPSPTPAYERIR